MRRERRSNSSIKFLLYLRSSLSLVSVRISHWGSVGVNYEMRPVVVFSLSTLSYCFMMFELVHHRGQHQWDGLHHRRSLIIMSKHRFLRSHVGSEGSSPGIIGYAPRYVWRRVGRYTYGSKEEKKKKNWHTLSVLGTDWDLWYNYYYLGFCEIHGFTDTPVFIGWLDKLSYLNSTFVFYKKKP